MKILFLSRWFPYPTDNGSKLRIDNLLRGLAKYHEVTLLSFADQVIESLDKSEAQAICKNVYAVPWREFDPQSRRARFGFLSLAPRSIVDTFSPKMAQQIKDILSSGDYDLVIASQLSMAAYRPYFKNIPAIFEEVEIGLSYVEFGFSVDFLKRIRRTSTWIKLRLYLSSLLKSFQACTVVSEQEYRLLSKTFSKYKSKIAVIPNCLNIDDYENLKPVIRKNQLIFSGSFRYHANYEAMLWFIGEVFPLILKQIPDAHLVITGDPAGLPVPSVPNVTLTGYVDDIKTTIASSWISIAPLLRGGGTRLKILEAMAVGTPVVSTSKGAEGLNAVSGEHLIIADSPNAFADQVISLLKDDDMRNHISVSGKRFVKENYNWKSVLPNLFRIMENLVS